MLEFFLALQALVATIAVIVGSVWTYYKVEERREGHPRVECDVEINFVGIQNDQWLVQLFYVLNNKGLVRHETRHCVFELRCIFSDDQMVDGAASEFNQVQFPQFIKCDSWIPLGGRFLFTEPGVQSRYSHICTIPKRASFILIRSIFVHDKPLYANQKKPDVNQSNTDSKNDIKQADSNNGAPFSQTLDLIRNHRLEYEQVIKVVMVPAPELALC